MKAAAIAVAIYSATLHPALAERVDTFGPISISKILQNRSFLLSASSAKTPFAFLNVQCFTKEQSIAVTFSTGVSEPPNPSGPTIVTLWSEIAKPVDLTAVYLAPGGFADLGNYDKSKPSESRQVAHALSIISESRVFTAFSMFGKTVRFDTEFLPAAWHRFKERCGRPFT